MKHRAFESDLMDKINEMDAFDFWFTLAVLTVSSVPIMVALLLMLE